MQPPHLLQRSKYAHMSGASVPASLCLLGHDTHTAKVLTCNVMCICWPQEHLQEQHGDPHKAYSELGHKRWEKDDQMGRRQQEGVTK